MKMRVFGGCLFLCLALSGCSHYGQPDDCDCSNPPANTCLDENTLQEILLPGTCVDSTCHYDVQAVDCPAGACVNGVCTTCQPDCSTTECGPDPFCGASCGDCPDCDGEPVAGLCMPDGTCGWPCCPDCGDRECGSDGCWGSCGTCEEGCTCTGLGTCECGCHYPSHSDDCSLVYDFQCGIEPTCSDGVITVNWHEHVMCGDMEDIVEFSCSYQCPLGCEDGYISDWPGSGAELVANNCF